MIFITLLAIGLSLSGTNLHAAAASEAGKSATPDSRSLSDHTILRMTDAATIAKNLQDAGFEDFSKKTEIVAWCGGEECYFLDIKLAIEHAALTYSESDSPLLAKAEIMTRKSDILKTLLKGATVIFEEEETKD